MIYIGPEVESVRELFVPTLVELETTYSIRVRLEGLADRLVEGHESEHPGAWVMAHNHQPALAGRGEADFFASEFDRDVARAIVARDHGWSGWSDVPDGPDDRVDPDFEIAVHAVISGDRSGLMECLGETPALVRARSALGHGATLLHYLAANGVEIYRQVAPLNGIEVAEFLLACGADPRAGMKAYGDEYGPLALLETSGHPQAAGTATGLAAVLRAADAR